MPLFPETSAAKHAPPLAGFALFDLRFIPLSLSALSPQPLLGGI